MTSLENLLLMNAAGMVKRIGDVHPLLRSPVTHVVLGTITVEERLGNPEPNFWVSPDGTHALNSRGLPGPGSTYYVEHGKTIADTVHNAGKMLVTSITSTQSSNDWRILAGVAAGMGSDVIEINISCPNKWKNGKNETVVAHDPGAVQNIVSLVGDAAPNTVLWVKLPPYRFRDEGVCEKILEFLGESEQVGAVVSANTIGGCTPPMVDGAPVISMPTAGMSGPKMRPWSLSQVHMLRRHSGLPIIGVGGVNSGEALVQYQKADVAGVQVGTHFFLSGPRVFSEILTEAAYLQ